MNPADFSFPIYIERVLRTQRGVKLKNCREMYMNRKSFAQTIVLLLLICAVGARAAPRGRVSAENGTVVTDRGTNLRGVPQWMMPYINEDTLGTLKMIRSEGYREFFRGISREYGLNAVRLCYTAWYAFNGDRFPKEKITPESYVAAIDTFVQWAAEDGIYIIINYHDVGHYDLEHMRQFWDYIGPRYKDRTHVIYELMNEPVKWYARSYDAQDIEMVKTLYQSVRADAPETHLILWTFANLGSAGQATETATVDGISYENASVGFHFGYGGGNAESIRQLMDDGLPGICTEFNSKDENTQSTDFGDLTNNVTVFEQTSVSWITWAPTAAMLNEPLRIDSQFVNAMNEADICWNPDYGNWPTDCSQDTTDPSDNKAPTVVLGSVDTIRLTDSVYLEATVSDDGLPEGSEITVEWKKLLGPGTVEFSPVDSTSTYATFSTFGEYTLSLEAYDGEKKESDLATVIVLAPTGTIREVRNKPDLTKQNIRKVFDLNGRRIDPSAAGSQRPAPRIFIGHEGTSIHKD